MLTRRFIVARAPRTKDLRDATRELAAEHINIEGFQVADGTLRLLTDHADKALEVLRSLGLQARIEEVLQFDLRNERGALADILDRLVDRNVEILDGAGIAGDDPTGPVFLRVDDIVTAERALESRLGGHVQRIWR